MKGAGNLEVGAEMGDAVAPRAPDLTRLVEVLVEVV